MYFLEQSTKALVILGMCRLECVFVVCMQHSRVSRDKLHMILFYDAVISSRSILVSNT